MDIMTWLDRCEEHFDPTIKMLGRTWTSPGYHSKLPTGAYVHSTREALYYAVSLIRSDNPYHVARAHEVIRATIALQNQDPTNRTYGIWPWTYEESLEQMSPPDWNWADFCGAPIAMMLHDDAGRIPLDLDRLMRTSLTHAAWSIFRRDVQSGYTNIAIMGAGVTAAAGEILGIPFLVDYGRKRLADMVAHTANHGDFSEYNSPTYTMVALEESERILHLVADPECRKHAEWLRLHAWKVIADHFHPATQQWAGPNSRTYADYLRRHSVLKLSRQTGVEIRAIAEDEDIRKSILDDTPVVVPEPPCPEGLRDRFRRLPSETVVIAGRFYRHDDEQRSLHGTTWLDSTCTLGSINHDTMWTQRRGLLGYWPAADGGVAVLRCRFLKDGKDFSSAGIVNVQQRTTVLTGVCLLRGMGDYHIHLDAPADGVFRACTLALRWSLHGKGARVEKMDEGIYRLTAGDRAAVVCVADALFDDRPIVWRTGEEAGDAWMEAVCHDGGELAFSPANLGPVRLIAGTAIIPASATAADVRGWARRPAVIRTDQAVNPFGHDALQGSWSATWAAPDGELKIDVPTTAVKPT